MNEHQAASIEETAAAIPEITQLVKGAAERAARALAIVAAVQN